MSEPKKKGKKKPGTDVAEIVEPLVLVERRDRVRITEESGIPIFVDGYGRFYAEVGDAELRRDTLAEIEEAVRRAVTATNRKKRAKTTKPVFAYGTLGPGFKSKTWCGDVFFTGVSAKNGEILIRFPDGTKDSGNLTLFRRDDPRRTEIEALVARKREAEMVSTEAGKRLSAISEEQTGAMYDGVAGAIEKGWSGKGFRVRHFNNDPEKALARTEAIVANLFGSKEDG